MSRYTLTCFLPLLERWRPRPWKRPSGESLHSYLFSPPIRKVEVALVRGKDHLVSRYTLTCFLSLLERWRPRPWKRPSGESLHSCFLLLLERWRPRPWKRPPGESLHSYLFSPPIRKVAVAIVLGKDHLVSRYTLTCFLPPLERWRSPSSLEKTIWWVVTLLLVFSPY